MLFVALFSLTTLPLCEAVGYNLAYRKPTWQTLEKYSSANAVDGLYETSTGGRDQCAMSYPSSKEVTWMVVPLASMVGIALSCHHCSILTGLCLGYCTPGYDGCYCDHLKRINMALHRPTFQMTSIIDKHQSDRLVDGKVLAGIITQGVCTSTKENQVFAMWVVNLQRPRRIERISVFSRTDNKTWDANNGFTKRLLGFSIIVSNTTDRRDGVVCFQDTHYTASTIPDEVEIYCSVIGQYVFYYNERLPGIHYPQDYSKYAHGDLCEIEVSDLENLSYKKRTWQSSTYDKLYSSDKAVDGMKSRHYSDGQCTITSPDQSITWWVNLQKQYRISFINLYFRTDNSTARCPSPVANLAECSKPCPSNCETCYPSTGFCTKCKPGFEGSACEVVCDAMNKAVITTDGFYNGSFNEMFTSNGQTFLPTHSGYARFILTLSGKATNIAKVSFTIHKAFNVIVAFTNGTQNFTRLYYDQFTGEEHWNVDVLNGFMSRVHLVRITVGYTVPLTISNLRLPLRSCFENEETTQLRQGMFKFVREIH
uniref:EGF-like domain-containing protein n=1 Tax=Magallana gigas TaxID=29159 RepID=A0A8W8MI90_MAGGI